MNNNCKEHPDIEDWYISAIQNGLKDVDTENMVDYSEIIRKWE